MKNNFKQEIRLLILAVFTLLLLVLCLCVANDTIRTGSATGLSKVFLSPPDSVKPSGYWWWINANVDKEAAILSAWFYDADNAYRGVKDIMSVRKNKTFLNADRIFQINANFGLTSAIAEMLIQSHRKDSNGLFVIDLLPSIPDDWATGSVKGLCATGGFEVDMEWEEGNLESVIIFSKMGGSCKIQFKDRITDLTLKPGEKEN